jgi:DNA helicase-2/ATP-dependent DNA helicase PcrA
MQISANHKKSFTEAYASLNDNQRKAVDTIEGPVLVVAGPGTGKTQILAVRIGKILMETDTLPDNILCLTYTDAGTIAMRKRLLDFIGPMPIECIFILSTHFVMM